MKHPAHCAPQSFGRTSRRLVAGLVMTATAAMLGLAPAFAQSTLQPTGPAWPVAPEFKKDAKARKAISGAACAPISPPVCLAGNDEKKYAQFFTIQDKTLVPDALIRLVPDQENGVAFDELDIEGVAFDGGFFYLIGSHGAPRKRDKPFDPSRCLLVRFQVNPQSGKPDFLFSDDVVDTQAIEKTNALREVIKNAPHIGPFAEKPLDEENGANIEGIAIKGEHIFLGFRGPSVDKNAFILQVDKHGVFGTAAMNPMVYPILLSNNVGIRDLAALKEGILILSGPAVGSAGTYAISYWHEESKDPKPTLLAVLGSVPADGKPETVIVLDESDPQHYRVLVLIESVENSAPLEYLVPRPSSP
jgi:hypothetical protein